MLQGFNSSHNNSNDQVLLSFANAVGCSKYALVELEADYTGRSSENENPVVLRRGNMSLSVVRQLIQAHSDCIVNIAGSASLSNLVFLSITASENWEPVLDAETLPDSADVTLALFTRNSHKQIVCLLGTFEQGHCDEKSVVNFHHRGLNLLSAEKIAAKREDGTFRLSQSEHQALVWCAKGKTSFEISKILSLSEHTINHYLNSAVRKLGASNRPHAVSKAILYGLIKLRDLA